MSVFEYDPPERFVAGTVGSPGERTFFLQACSGSAVTSVSLEKQQVAVLAERIRELLDEVSQRLGAAAEIPALSSLGRPDDQPLSTPVEQDFSVGSLTLTWDSSAQRLVLDCQSAGDSEQVLRVRLSGTAAREFVRRAQAVVAAGRPPCPFCGGPISAQGHVCPRANGHRR